MMNATKIEFAIRGNEAIGLSIRPVAFFVPFRWRREDGTRLAEETGGY